MTDNVSCIDSDNSSSENKKVKIAILNCPGSREFSPLFLKLFADFKYLNEDQSVTFDFTVFDVPGGDISTKLSTKDMIIEYDVYLITGSFSSAYEDLPWINDLKALILSIFEIEFKTQEAEKQKSIEIKSARMSKNIKLLGICFGHQIIAHALGEICGNGLCSKNPQGWTLGVDSIFINGEDSINYWNYLQKKLSSYKQDNSANLPAPSTLHLLMNYVHQDHILNIPTLYNIKSFGEHPTAKHSYGFYNWSNLLTFQGHPEFDLEVMESIIDTLQKKDVISEENVDLRQITDSLQTKVNREALARSMIGFCLP